MSKKIFFILLVVLATVTSVMNAANIKDDPEARAILEKAYDQVFGQEGSTLQYNVNLVGIYKTNGTIWYKGKKNKFIDNRYNAWCDGKTIYMVHRKKKTVTMYDADSEKADKYRSKFKFSFDDFTYSKTEKGNVLLLTLKQKKSAKGTVKEAQIALDAKTLSPLSARIKVLLFWANIKISNFKAGGIDDAIFTFPAKDYATGYKKVDKRGI